MSHKWFEVMEPMKFGKQERNRYERPRLVLYLSHLLHALCRKKALILIDAVSLSLVLHAGFIFGLATEDVFTAPEELKNARTTLATHIPGHVPKFADDNRPYPSRCVGCGFYEKGMKHTEQCYSVELISPRDVGIPWSANGPDRIEESTRDEE